MDKAIEINLSSSSEVEASTLNNAEPVVSISRHSRFYATGEGVIFLIENKLYRIPEYILCQSEFFRDMLQSPALGDSTTLEGKVDDSPVVPADITTIEIESLLELLFAQALHGLPTLDYQHLSAALHLSTKWGFDKAREHIIKEIDKLYGSPSPLDQIELAFKCSVPKWLVPEYTRLCLRPGQLTWDEARRLGIQKHFAISQIREKLARQSIPSLNCCLQHAPKIYCCGHYCAYTGVDVRKELDNYREALDLGHSLG